jgi:hypothetical protein
MNKLLNKMIWVFAFLAALVVPPAGKAQGLPTPSAPSDLGFLEIGRSYAVKFIPGMHPFEVKESQMVSAEAESTDASGKVTKSTLPGSMTMTYRIDVFVVRKLGGGSWALLEHPADVKAAQEILGARRALEDTELVAEQGKTEEGRKQLAKWREEARRELKMTQTWVNLAHAIVIADPDEESKKSLRVNVEIKK